MKSGTASPEGRSSTTAWSHRSDLGPLTPQTASAYTVGRPTVAGRFLHVGGEKLLVRGVTYGTFAPGPDGAGFPDRRRVALDFRRMAASGFNAIRTYEVPPRWLLDLAGQNGLRVLVGLSWTQHVTFLSDRKLQRSIREMVRTGARSVASHSAVLGFAIGNEVPSPIVRWENPKRVADFLEGLYDIVKSEDPTALTTYVNYPTTEYLELPFLDFLSFNVYLEDRDSLNRYLARLHNLAGNRPLIMAEIGLDSRRNGESAQAESLGWQIRAAMESGCAGAFVFSWTDQWHRGGFDIDDWDFGLTTRAREPKPALSATSQAFARACVEEPAGGWPSISVVCCSYNGSATIRDTLHALRNLAYPDFEVIVVDDGSTDATPKIAAEYSVRLISTENRGLSSARNTGAQAAKGEIVAFIDDDAYPDQHWLHFLGREFREGGWAAVGGPNILPPDSNGTSECVSHSPGGPVHVLMTDVEAEHIPGCNLAVRKDAFDQIGGFDTRFRVAGDDVDFCWRVHAQGLKIGFHHGAMVFHHCRSSIRRYWRQQKGYGKAEAILERKWPEKYNVAGHLSWMGRLYGNAFFQNFGWAPPRVYYGVWGSAPFQALYHRGPGTILTLAMMPEWHLLLWVLTILSVLGISWPPLLLAVPVLAFAGGVTIWRALSLAIKASRGRGSRTFRDRARFVTVTAWLHLIQPAARLWGRFGEGLTPWRHHGLSGWTIPRKLYLSVWSETWRSAPDWVDRLRNRLRAQGARPFFGGPTDRWDLEVRGGVFGGARMLLAVEEHGAGKQYLRVRIWPHIQFRLLDLVAVGFLILGLAAIFRDETIVGGVLGGLAALLGGLIWEKCGAAVATLRRNVMALVEPFEVESEKEVEEADEALAATRTGNGGIGDSTTSRRRRHVLADRPEGEVGGAQISP